MLNEQTESSGLSASGSPIVAKLLSIEWLGQTVASLCWIASVFVYGIAKSGDVLQLAAASAWFVANMASLASAKAS